MALKVSELIELLKAFPPDYEVVIEGCDCYGDAKGVYKSEGAVVISRDEVVDNPY